MFRMLISKMGALEVARYFIALLYLVTKGKINLEQSEDSEDNKNYDQVSMYANY